MMLEIAKGVISFGVSMGVGTVVRNGIKHTTPANLNVVQKAAIGVGGYVLSNMVMAHANEYVDKEIDKVKKSFNAMKKSEVKVEVVKVEA